MFQKNAFLVMLSIIIVFSSFNRLLAQENEDKTIIISQRVGAVIDLEERNYFKLFPGIKGFQSAKFFQLPDSTFKVKLTYLEDQIEKTRFGRLRESEIKKMRESIDHFEEIQIGIYQPKIGTPTPKTQLIKVYEKPSRLKAGKVAGEFLLGSVGALVGGITGMAICGKGEESDDFDGYAAGFLIGSTVGSSIGVYIIGVWGEETGSFRDAFLGSFVGTIIGTGLVFALYSELNYELDNFGAFTLIQSVGATLAFNKTRRKEVVIPAEAILQFKEGNWSLNCPQIYLKSNPLRKGDWIRTVNLVGMDF